jgi:hypothetical protein
MKNLMTFLFSLTFYSLVYGQIPTDGLVAYFPFNGNANSAVNGIMPSLSTGAFSTDRNNLTGRAIQFVPTENHRLEFDLTQYPELALSGNFTISFWFRYEGPETPVAEPFFFDFDGKIRGGLTRAFQIGGWYGSFFGNRFNGTQNIPVTEPPLNASVFNQFQLINNWFHYTLVKNDTQLIVYKNGNPAAIINFPNNIISFNEADQKLYIARSKDNNSENIFTGSIDDLLIYNRALSFPEVNVVRDFNPSSILVLQQPENQVICVKPIEDFDYNFSVFTTESDGDYQWFNASGDVALENNANFSGVTTNTLSITNPVNLADQYYCVISNGSSNVATNTVGFNTSNNLSSSNIPNLTNHWPIEGLTPNQSILGDNNLVPNTGVQLGVDRFNNANQAYEITSKEGVINLSNVLNGNPQTISFWYQYKGTGAANLVNTLLSNGTVNTGGPILVVLATNNLVVWSNQGAAIAGGITLTLNQWYHIAYVRHSNTDIRVYVNGQQINNTTNNVTQLFANRIGNNRDGFTTQGALGNFDDIRYYTTAINQDDVNALFQNNVSDIQLIQGLPETIPACNGSDIALSIEVQGSNLSYAWKLGNNFLDANENTLLLENYNAGSQTLKVFAYSNESAGCIGVTSETSIVEPIEPITPILSLDSPDICPNGIASFTITNFDAANNFTYEIDLPEGWEIISHEGNKVFFSNNAEVGAISVTAKNDCNISSTAAILTPTLNTNPLVEISEITGNQALCRSNNLIIYSVQTVAGAIENGYFWNLPEGVTGTSTTNSIALNFNGSTPGDKEISVFAITNNGCSSELAEKSISLDINPSGQQIAGINEFCDLTEYTLNAPNVGGSTVEYQWQLPAGFTPISPINESEITFLSGTVAGNVNLLVKNTCTGVSFVGLQKTLSRAVQYSGTIQIEDGIITSTENTFNSYTLYKGDEVIATSDSNGNINFDTQGDCGDYYAVFEKTESNCVGKTVSVVRSRTSSITCAIAITPSGISYPATVNLGSVGNFTLTEAAPNLNLGPSNNFNCADHQFTITDAQGCSATVLTTGLPLPGSSHNLTLTGDEVSPCPITSNTLNVNTILSDISIEGNTCLGNTVTLMVEPLSDDATYNWILPEGLVGASTTNSIDVEVNAAGLVEVEAINDCETFTKTLQVEITPFGVATITRNGNAITSNYPFFDSYVLYKNDVEVASGTGGVINYEDIECGDYQAIFSNPIDDCGDITVNYSGNSINVISDSYPITLNFTYSIPAAFGNVISQSGPTTTFVNSNTLFVNDLSPSGTFPTRFLTFTKPNGCTYTASISLPNNSFTIISPDYSACDLYSNIITIGAEIEAVNAPTAACEGQTLNLSVTEIEGAIYTWVLPEGWLGASTTNTIEITPNDVLGPVSVSSEDAICGVSNSVEFKFVNPALPANFSVNFITSDPPFLSCGAEVTFSMPSNPTHSSYHWTLPSGTVEVTETSSLTLTITEAGILTVNAVNACGAQNEPVTRNLTFAAPSGSMNISGLDFNGNYCEGSELSLTANVNPPITDLVDFVWTLPEGWQGESNTNQIQITVGSTSGEISVSRRHCGVSTSPFTVPANSFGIPASPVYNNDFEFICQGTITQPRPPKVIEIEIEPNTNAVWTVPDGFIPSAVLNNSISIRSNNDHTFSDTIRVASRYFGCPLSAEIKIPVNIYSISGTPLEILDHTATNICLGEEATVTFDPTIQLSTSSNSFVSTISGGYSFGGTTQGNIVTFINNEFSGANTFRLNVFNACNSVHLGNFDVDYYPSEIVISQNAETLNVAPSLLNIQWYFNINPVGEFAPIEGANSASYTPTQNGYYKVTAESEFGCEGESDSFLFNAVSIKELSNEKRVKIFPNPVSNVLNIEGAPLGSTLKIIDVSGKVIMQNVVANQLTFIEVATYAKGIYFVQITTNNEIATLKWIKN